MSSDMQELFKEAAKIAAVVPESMQEAAFNRALDMLTNSERTPAEKITSPRRAAKKRAPSTPGRGDVETPAVDRVAQVTAIARDAAPEVDQETSVQGRSIALLVAAKREADVDGLTSPEIAKILTDKFRHKTTRQAVTQAMDAAGSKIDRQRSGNDPIIYRVMKTGEDWLSAPADQRTTSSSGRPRRRPGTKRVTAPAQKTRTANKATPAQKTASAGTGRRTGPKGVLESLIDEGYFSEPRGMADIRQHVRDQRATNFSNSDLSPTLIRLLREGKLKRNKVEKQYVYSAG
ncbi:hypothetical protein GCM10028777_02560 [Angustibacter speluncae]